MEKLYVFFPVTGPVKAGDLKSLLISMLIYIVADVVVGVLAKILGWIPLVGVLVGIAAALLSLYFLVGVVLSIIKFAKK